MNKNCIFCNSSNVKKNGPRRSVQMYSYKDCGRQFQGGLHINNISLWNDYLTANRTISDLSTLYKCSERTIRRRLSLVVDSFTSTYPQICSNNIGYNILFQNIWCDAVSGCFIRKNTLSQVCQKRN